ncbi:MAG: ATP-binding protein [Thermodesulfobacteriota bacterium]
MSSPVFKKITRLVGRAIGDFTLIEDGDRILCALSGGKDSWTLLYALLALQRRAPVSYTLHAVTVDPGSGPAMTRPLEEHLAREGIPYSVIPGNIVDIIGKHLTEGTSPCAFCSRLRRGLLYTFAATHGWNKIALGHHMDDFVETLLLNLFFNSSIKGMSPHLVSDDKRNTVIRPLVYVKEALTAEAAKNLGVPIVSCNCPLQCTVGSRRQWAKELLARIEKDVPQAKASMLAAMGRVELRHLLVRDRAL